MLIKNYYTVDSMTATEGGATFRVTLNPSCGIYAGHFPSHPISPGVCNIRMVTECAESLLGKSMRITEIHRCRFTKLITPADTPHLTVRLNLLELPSPESRTATEDSAVSGTGKIFRLKAEIADDQTVCLTLDCTLTEE